MPPPIRSLVFLLPAALLLCSVPGAHAQSLGSFTWQLQPFCNRVTVNVRQDGTVYTLDGVDDECGAAQKAPLVGLAAVNPDGSIGFGLNIVAPGGQAVPVQARISIATLSGTWRDSAGNSGTFGFGTNTGGSPRPLVTGVGDVTGVTAGTGLTGGGGAGDVTLAVNPAVVQSRVTTACPAGQAMRSIAEGGTAVCESISGTAGGDITGVTAGVGLTGGATSGEATLSAVFGGDGVLGAAARADHEHADAATQSVGVGPAALGTTGGGQQTAVGFEALRSNTSGANNTAVGAFALRSLTSAQGNTAVGAFALSAVTSAASDNTAVGVAALRNTVDDGNTAVGASALTNNTVGTDNVAVGATTLFANVAGSRNVALGFRALQTSLGSANVGVGASAGSTIGTGSENTLVGSGANGASTGVTGGTALGAFAFVGASNATAIGARARVDRDNTIVLGGISGVNGATADARVGIGTATPGARLSIADQGGATQLELIGAGILPQIVGRRSQGSLAAPATIVAGASMMDLLGTGFNSVFFEDGARIRLSAAEDWSPNSHGARIEFNTTPNGAGGTFATRMIIDHDGEVGIGTLTPAATLHVAGTIRVDTLGGVGGTTLCRNASNQIATCSSSLRYKEHVTPYTGGLAVLQRFQPIGFTWRDGGMADVGFGAEDVAAIDPRLATFNDAGQVEGVKYDRLTTVLVNAVKELEGHVRALQRDRQALEARLAALESRAATRER